MFLYFVQLVFVHKKTNLFCSVADSDQSRVPWFYQF